MKKKFKVGDRVRCYGASRTGEIEGLEGPVDGVIELLSGDFLVVTVDGRTPENRPYFGFNAKQCRRLRKKAAKVYEGYTVVGEFDYADERVAFRAAHRGKRAKIRIEVLE